MDEDVVCALAGDVMIDVTAEVPVGGAVFGAADDVHEPADDDVVEARSGDVVAAVGESVAGAHAANAARARAAGPSAARRTRNCMEDIATSLLSMLRCS